MIIRCPQCEHARTISEHKIPPTAELATCPRCKHRFRFRTLQPAVVPEPAEAQPTPPPPREREKPSGIIEPGDIWDAVDSLHHRWQAQMEKNVTVVETPKPAATPPEEAPAEPQQSGEPGAYPTAPPSPSSGQQPAPAAMPEARQTHMPQEPQYAVPEKEPFREAPPAPEPPQYPEPSPSLPLLAYTTSGTPPEQKVERDLLLLHDETERPMRDLGKLDDRPDLPEAPISPDPRQSAENQREEDGGSVPDNLPDDDIPWENPSAYGWRRAFTSTLHGVMFNGPAFFSRIRGKGSLAPGYLFFLLLSLFAIGCSAFWTQAAFRLLRTGEAVPQSSFNLSVILLVSPIVLGLVQLFITGFIRVMLSLFAPEKAGFAAIFKIVSYSVSPLILSIVPFVGPVVGALWVLAALLTGCRSSLGISWQLAVAVPLPPALCLFGGLLWYFL